MATLGETGRSKSRDVCVTLFTMNASDPGRFAPAGTIEGREFGMMCLSMARPGNKCGTVWE